MCHESLIKSSLAVLFCVSFAGCAETQRTSTPANPADAGHGEMHAKVGPADAMKRLVDGNARFVAGQSQHPRQDPGQRTALAGGQAPFAVIVSCADSRTGPEILFDQGLGDLFVVRVAGNVVDDQSIGSVEYAVEHLHAPLIVVMGHERCGAISAARATVAGGGHAEGHVESLVAAIRPAVEATTGQDAEATCRANVRNVVQTLRTSKPVLRPMVDSDQIRVVGAYYDLDSGAVTFLGDK